MSYPVKALRAMCVVALALAFAAPAAAQQVVQRAGTTLVPQAILSPEATLALEAALAGDMAADLGLLGRAFLFPSMQGGGTLMMMGFRMSESGLMFGADTAALAEAQAEVAAGTMPPETAAVEIFGSVTQNGVEVRSIGTTVEIPKATGGAERTATFSFGDTLPAGSYEIVWGVRDVVSGRTAMRQDTLEVPNFMAGGLSTSSVLMVESTSAAPGMFQPNTVYYGVRILTVSFMDNLTHEFPKATDSIMLTFLVSGAQFDAAAQAPSLELEYRIFDVEGERIWQAPPQPLNRATVGQQIPLSQISVLEAGNDYVFEITAKDLIAGTDTVTTVPFRITE
jgi:hypothetical protein